MFWILCCFIIGCGVFIDGAVIEARDLEVTKFKPVNRTARSNKIVGGDFVPIEWVPYQVGLLYVNILRCGGSIISYQFVLTAAHCVSSINQQLLQVRAGSSYHNQGGVLYNVRAVQMPTPPVQPDIAVLMTTQNMALNGITMRAVQLPWPNDFLFAGSPVLVSGWGMIIENGTHPDHLRAVTVPVTPVVDCINAHLTPTYNTFEFCAGFPDGGKDSCQGDSGGPAVWLSPAGPVQFGVVSCGEGCARPRFPGIYTSVPAMRNWIYSVTGV